MRELTETLQSILQTESGHINLFPAVGGAQKELTNVDDGERDDAKLSSENKR